MTTRRSLRRAALLPAVAIACGCAPQATQAPASAPPAAAVPADCSRLHFDLVRGTLNGVTPTASMDEVKRRLPCFTGESPEGEVFNFGGGVFFLDHDFYFYTNRNYIEVRSRFKGTVTPDVLGRPLAEARQVLGPQARTLQRRGSMLFRAGFGCVELRLDRDASAVEQVAAYSMLCEFVPDET
jgi:hypothetical protein